MKTLEDLQNILFEQIDLLTNLNVKDENFESERLKVETIANVADRILKTDELNLKNQVWQATRKFKLNIRQIGVSDD